MRKINFIHIVLIFVGIFIFQFCSAPKPLIEERVIPADRLIKKIEGNRRKVKTFEGSGVIKVESSQFTGSANFEVTLKKPDSIKFSIYGPFGIDLAHGLISNTDFQFYDVMRNKLFIGSNDKSVLKDLFKVDLSFNELLDAFSGSINLTDKLLKEPDEFQQNNEVYTLRYIDKLSKFTSTYVVNVSDLALKNFEVTDDENESVIKSLYEDIKLFNDVPIPYQVTIDYIKTNQKLVLEYRKMNVNKDVNNLELRLPQNIEIIKL